MTTMAFVKKIKRKKGKSYAIEVEGYRDKEGKVKHKYKRYLGTLDEKGNILPSQKEINVDKVYQFGFPSIVAKAIEDLKLKDAAEDYEDEIAIMVLMQVCNPSSISKMMKRIIDIDPSLRDVDLPINRKRVENVLDYLEEKKELIEENLYDNLKHLYAAETLFYDITSVALHGYRSSLAKVGYPEFSPQINIGLCIEAENGFPIFHEVFSGNIAHKSTLLQIKHRLQIFERENIVLIFDAGIAASEGLLQDAASMGFEVISRVPMHENMKRLALENITKSFKDMTKLPSAKVYSKEIPRKKGKLLVCLNERTRLAVREKRYDEILDAIDRKKKGQKIKEGLKKYLIKEEGQWRINYEAVEEAEKYDGIYVLSSSMKDMPKEDIVKAYFGRDRIEKCFSLMKGMLGIKPLRFQTDKRIRSRIMLCYLAYLITTYIETKLKENEREYTIEKTKEVLSNVYNVHLYRGDKHLKRMTSVNEEQKKIMDVFDLLS